MGMTIDEAIKHYEDVKKGLYLVYPEELYDFTIDTMRKYQKIEAIVNSPVYIQEDVIRYKMICEVLGAPRP